MGKMKLKLSLVTILLLIFITSITIVSLEEDEMIVKEEVPELRESYVYGTGSMMPLIKPDSKLIYTTDFEIKDGDIVLFYDYKNEKIVHRIYSILKIQDKLYYVTKGDDNKKIDRCLTARDDVYGKVVRVE